MTSKCVVTSMLHFPEIFQLLFLLQLESTGTHSHDSHNFVTTVQKSVDALLIQLEKHSESADLRQGSLFPHIALFLVSLPSYPDISSKSVNQTHFNR